MALGASILLACLPAVGGAEPEETPLPIVTLDALPLGIPLGSLGYEGRSRAEAVLAGSLLAQRVTGIRFRSREAVFRFLLDHPEFAAGVARALRLGRYRVTPEDDGYWGDDGRGARGTIRVIYADDGRRLYHLAGRYDPPALPAIEGQLLALFEFRHEEDAHGASVVDGSLTGHLRIDTPVVGAIAQALSALTRPLVERAVERKVRRFFNTVARVSRWAYDEPEQLAAMLDGHPELPQDPTLVAFRGILLADRPPAWARLPFYLLPPATADP